MDGRSQRSLGVVGRQAQPQGRADVAGKVDAKRSEPACREPRQESAKRGTLMPGQGHHPERKCKDGGREAGQLMDLEQEVARLDLVRTLHRQAGDELRGNCDCKAAMDQAGGQAVAQGRSGRVEHMVHEVRSCRRSLSGGTVARLFDRPPCGRLTASLLCCKPWRARGACLPDRQQVHDWRTSTVT